jgi:hypothetical protein
MQYLNDDMDELWRKAADEYPLNTGGADWNALAARMGLPPEKPRRKNRRYLLLLLLLLLPWVCIEYHRQDAGEAARTAKADAAPANRKVETALRTQEPVSQDPTALSGEVIPGKNKTSAQETGRPATAQTPVTSTTGMTAAPTDIPCGITVPTAARSLPPAKPRRVISKSLRSSYTPLLAQSRQTHRNYRKESRPDVAAAAPTVSGKQSDASPSVGDKETQMDGASTVPDPALATINEKVKTAVAPTDTLSKTTIALSTKPADSAAVAPLAKADKKKAAHQQHVYAGVLAGTGITTVEGQKVQRMGMDIGIVAGYSAGRHWAFEAGLLWSRKHYYSSADKLKEEVYAPRYYVLTDVQGDCRMIEIPVTVQYHFGGRKGNFFASAGVSSYLMKREDYVYNYKNPQYGSEYAYPYTYRNATRDWASQLQLSAGYRLSLPRNFRVRLEPYVQLPLKDAGYGRLPLTSAGLRVALTKTLF